MKIDLHIHSSVSDGTDSPAQILEKVRAAKIRVFSLTDHDDFLGTHLLQYVIKPEDPVFIPGIELSAREGEKKYHILGYAYDEQAPSLTKLVQKVSDIRQEKARKRLNYLINDCGFTFSEQDMERFLNLPNPGKPHLGSMMVKYGYAKSISEGIETYLNHYHFPYEKITPKEAIEAILMAGGIPVLAHCVYGDGNQFLDQEEIEERVARLCDMGLMGLETYYSRYDESLQQMVRKIGEKYQLLATAGSDYHGKHKTVQLGENHLEDAMQDEAVSRFLEKCSKRMGVSI